MKLAIYFSHFKKSYFCNIKKNYCGKKNFQWSKQCIFPILKSYFCNIKKKKNYRGKKFSMSNVSFPFFKFYFSNIKKKTIAVKKKFQWRMQCIFPIYNSYFSNIKKKKLSRWKFSMKIAKHLSLFLKLISVILKILSRPRWAIFNDDSHMAFPYFKVYYCIIKNIISLT